MLWLTLIYRVWWSCSLHELIPRRWSKPQPAGSRERCSGEGGGWLRGSGAWGHPIPKLHPQTSSRTPRGLWHHPWQRKTSFALRYSLTLHTFITWSTEYSNYRRSMNCNLTLQPLLLCLPWLVFLDVHCKVEQYPNVTEHRNMETSQAMYKSYRPFYSQHHQKYAHACLHVLPQPSRPVRKLKTLN